MVERFGLGADSPVVEIASNDGYLLQHFVDTRHPGAWGRACGERRGGRQRRGIETVVSSSAGSDAATSVARWRQADLLVANNVLAHVPDLNDFVAGMRWLLLRGA